MLSLEVDNNRFLLNRKLLALRSLNDASKRTFTREEGFLLQLLRSK